MILLVLLAASCRRQPKPNVLSYIPPEAPLVAWMPEPQAAITAADAFLLAFAGSTLGEQVRAIRSEVQRQVGVDPLDAKSFASFGLDLKEPWAIAADKTGFVALLAAEDPAKFLERFTQLMRETALIQDRSERGGVYVFNQPFGNVVLEQFAVRLADKAVLVTAGDGGAARLQTWPQREPQNFQKFWKKAASDGSMPGAVARLFARDTQRLLPQAISEALGPKAELRSALTLNAGRAELFTTVLGVDAERLKNLALENTSKSPGLGFSDKSVVWARSTLRAQKLVELLRELTLFAPLAHGVDAALGTGTLDSLAKLASGEAAFGIEMDPSQLPVKPPDRVRALLDAFPITATAKLTGELEPMLPTLQSKLKERGLSATIEGGRLRASTLSQRSQATLSHHGEVLTYAIGPGAFERLQSRLEKNEGLSATHHAFAPLLEPQTSGVVVDLGALLVNSQALLGLLFGEQSLSGTLARSLLGRTLDSFSRFDTLGLTLQFEGFAMQPHPVIRAWLTTKAAQ